MTYTDQDQASPAYDTLMQGNLVRVFNERDADRRMAAIAELYDPQAILYETQSQAAGHVAINEAVEALLTNLPADFVFTIADPPVGHHGVARLRWQGGSPAGTPIVTGTDVALIANGRIHALYVFLDTGK